ncbi:unnamed protein product [Bursaphelenchus xylophilus]|uniref:(pine wood nematode) hypothetical protein n=1 Tax=Bursaphelenchus xylophilus TaxID=6326 RepID=A0A1I7S105_BURXY|nr:unnamed protein product [Bursaphelenchus xylophilus]CAG9087969.1 unnamed protein product [Bursaphelenchus xylophilus]
MDCGPSQPGSTSPCCCRISCSHTSAAAWHSDALPTVPQVMPQRKRRKRDRNRRTTPLYHSLKSYLYILLMLFLLFAPTSTAQQSRPGVDTNGHTRSLEALRARRAVQQIGHLDANGRIVVDSKVDTSKLFKSDKDVLDLAKGGPIRLDSAAAAALLSDNPEALKKLAKISGKKVEDVAPTVEAVKLPTSEEKDAKEEKARNLEVMDLAKVRPNYSIYFNRTIRIDDKVIVDVINEGRDETFKLNHTIRQVVLDCTLTLKDLQLQNSSSPIIHWADFHTSSALSNSSRLILRGKQLADVIYNGLYPTCTAQIAVADVSEPITVFSRTLNFPALRKSDLKIWPRKVAVPFGKMVRLECVHNYTEVKEMLWWHNEKLIEESDRKFEVYSNPHRLSVLYIPEIERQHIGLYECGIRLRSNVTIKSRDMAEVTAHQTADDTVLAQEAELPAEAVEAREYEPLMVECWDEDFESQWYKVTEEGRDLIANSTVLYFNSVEKSDKAVYECFQTDGNETIRVFKTKLEVKPQAVDFETEEFTTIYKNQGTPVKIMCETHPSLDETPEMATWFKDGVEIRANERVYRRVENIGEGAVVGKALFISLAQKTDEGMYECVVRKGHAQRLQHNLLKVKKSTELVLKNLEMKVDHVKASFTAHFDLPDALQYWEGMISTYFLVYHTADRLKALNIMPGNGARCTENNHCVMDVHPPYPLGVATAYTFRISMVVDEKASVITPLSAEVNATSWDGTARSSLELDWAFKDEHLEIHWKRPEVPGELKDYQIDLFNLSSAITLPEGGEKPHTQRFRIFVAANQTSYQLDIPSPFAFKVRVIPRTRALLPSPYKLESVKEFGYTLIVVDEEKSNVEVDWSIPAPTPKIEQVGAEPKLKLSFNVLDTHNVTSVRVHYRPLSNLYQGENKESNEVIDGEVDTNHSTLADFTTNVMTLTEDLKVGTVYQVCSAYERKDLGQRGQGEDRAQKAGKNEKFNTKADNSDSQAQKSVDNVKSTKIPKIGLWHCQNVPLLDQKGRVKQLKADDSFSPTAKREPTPVDCAKFGYCRCVQSRDDRSLILIRWPRNAVGDHADVGGFILNYRYDGPEDLEVKKRKANLFTEGNETVSYIQDLFPGFTYKIWINVFNSELQEYQGSEFSCKTPENLPLPPPVEINTTQLSDRVLQVSWKPPIPTVLLSKVPYFDGYNVHWKKVGQREGAGYFVEGHDVNNHILTTQEKDEYAVYITSHSSLKGESPLKSEVVSAIVHPKSDKNHNVPQIDVQKTEWFDGIKVKEYREEDHRPKFYQSAHFREWVLIILVVLLTIAIIGTVAMIVYVQCGDRIFDKDDDDSFSGISSGRRTSCGSRMSAASSSLSLKSNGSVNFPMSSGGIMRPLYEREHLIGFNETHEPPQLGLNNIILDSKGGPMGFREKRQKKVQKIMADPNFAKKLDDLNGDPTGMGKSFEEVLEDLANEQRNQDPVRYIGVERRFSRQSPPHSPDGSLSTQSNPQYYRPYEANFPLDLRRQQQTQSLPNQSNSTLNEDRSYPHRYAHSTVNIGQDTPHPTVISDSVPSTNTIKVQAEVHDPNQTPDANFSMTKSNSLVGFPEPNLAELSQEMSTSDGNLCEPITSSQLFKRPALSFESFPEDAENLKIPLIRKDQDIQPAERRRLKTGLEPEPPANNTAHTTSMPNLADSGIVYDDCGNHIGLALPLHTINSEKILRNIDFEEGNRFDKTQLSDNYTDTSSSAASSRGSDHADNLGPMIILSPSDAFHALGSRRLFEKNNSPEYDENAIEMREFKIDNIEAI